MILLTIAHPKGHYERRIFEWLDEAEMFAEILCHEDSRYVIHIVEDGQNIYKAMRHAKDHLKLQMEVEGLWI